MTFRTSDAVYEANKPISNQQHFETKYSNEATAGVTFSLRLLGGASACLKFDYFPFPQCKFDSVLISVTRTHTIGYFYPGVQLRIRGPSFLSVVLCLRFAALCLRLLLLLLFITSQVIGYDDVCKRDFYYILFLAQFKKAVSNELNIREYFWNLNCCQPLQATLYKPLPPAVYLVTSSVAISRHFTSSVADFS